MSIQSIDAQIMVQRTADTLRDVSALQRHPQFTQETLAARNITESAQDQSRVQEALESEMQEIRADVEGGGAGAAGGGGGGGGEEEEEMTEEQQKELLVAPAAHEQIIDIMI